MAGSRGGCSDRHPGCERSLEHGAERVTDDEEACSNSDPACCADATRVSGWDDQRLVGDPGELTV